MSRARRTAGGARTLPGHYYTSTAIFAREMHEIFASRWLLVGRASEVAQPGSYLVFELAPVSTGPEPVPHESVIVIRGDDGVLRGLFNVCRHRGARICTQAGQARAVLRCPYHAWTYALDGRLLGAPNMSEVAGFERGDYPLVTAAVAEWEGFVFVNLAPEPVPFAEALAPLHDKLTAWQLPRLALARRLGYEVGANWKLLFENYAECYHCPIIHPALERITPQRDADNDLERGEILGGPMRISGADASLSEDAKPCGPVLVAGDERERVYYYTLFPNMFIALHPDYVLTHRLDPLAIDRTRVECEWLFDPGWAEHADSDPERAVAFWDRVNRQDWHVAELAQHGVRSRAYAPGPYAELESVSAAFDQAYLAALGELG